MSATIFPLASPIPVLLSWGASPLTVVNQSTSATAYLNDSPGLDTYPLGPAQAIRWDAAKPLYASCAPGQPLSLALSTDAGTLFSPVATVAP